jgi:hypothetical protein
MPTQVHRVTHISKTISSIIALPVDMINTATPVIKPKSLAIRDETMKRMGVFPLPLDKINNKRRVRFHLDFTTVELKSKLQTVIERPEFCNEDLTGSQIS